MNPSKRLRLLDVTTLRERLAYDESIPSCLRWKVSPSRNVPSGEPAGHLATNHYYRVRINNEVYFAHHLVLILHDDWPEEGQQCDHINRDRNDNRVSNLRWVSHARNQRNKRAYAASGYKYVYPDRTSVVNPYMATYRRPADSNQVYVGKFADPYNAHLHAITHRLERCWHP